MGEAVTQEGVEWVEAVAGADEGCCGLVSGVVQTVLLGDARGVTNGLGAEPDFTCKPPAGLSISSKMEPKHAD